MKRTVFTLVVAIAAICQTAYAEPYARHSNRLFFTGMPNTLLTSSDKDHVPGEPILPQSSNVQAPDPTHGYPFADRCGTNAPCCEGLWDGYSRGCCWARLHSRLHQACGGCDACQPACGSRLGHHLHGGRGCGSCNSGCGFGGFGGCFGGSFAGGCGSCGGGFAGGGMRRLGLHRGAGMFLGGEEDCGCNGGAPGMIQKGHSELQAPPSVPTEAMPSVEQAPIQAPVPEKSAFRPLLPRAYGIFPTNW